MTAVKTYPRFEVEVKRILSWYKEQAGHLYARQLDYLTEWYNEVVEAYELYDMLNDKEYAKLMKLAILWDSIYRRYVMCDNADFNLEGKASVGGIGMSIELDSENLQQYTLFRDKILRVVQESSNEEDRYSEMESLVGDIYEAFLEEELSEADYDDLLSLVEEAGYGDLFDDLGV